MSGRNNNFEADAPADDWSDNPATETRQIFGNQWVGAMAALAPAPARNDVQTDAPVGARIAAPVAEIGNGAPMKLNAQGDNVAGLLNALAAVANDAGPPRLRAGVDFEHRAPVAPNLTGSDFVQHQIENTPLQVRERIEGAMTVPRDPSRPALDSVQSRLAGLRINSPESQQIFRDYAPYAVPMLIQQLGNEDYRVREAAHSTLERLGDAALPSLITFSDNPAIDLESRIRARQLISRISANADGDISDAQGRLRVMFEPKFGGIRGTADYDANGNLSRATWGTGNAEEVFTRNANGTYTRNGHNVSISSVAFDRDGLRFGVDGRTIPWGGSRIQVRDADGAVQLECGAHESTSIPIQHNGAIVMMRVAPAAPDYTGKLR